VLGKNGFVIDVDGNEVPTNVFSDKIILNELGLNALGQLDKNQVRFILLKHLGYGIEWNLSPCDEHWSSDPRPVKLCSDH